MPTIGVWEQMIMVRQYTLEEDEDGQFHVRSEEVSVCPVCGYAVYVIGVRNRKYFKEDGEKRVLIIRRLRCKKCQLIHHELPDILIPYKRHCIDTVEKIVSGNKDDVCCENNTIRRVKKWWSARRPYFEGILASLREKYGNVFSQEPAPREIIRAVVNANCWLHTRSACMSS
jgi:hypothetical protein